MQPHTQITKVGINLNVLNKATPLWVTLVTVLGIISSIVHGCGSNQLAKEANKIAKEAGDNAKKATDIAVKQFELSHLTPLLVVPVSYEPYVAEGNSKAKITVFVGNSSQTDYANNVQVNFIIDDGTGRQVSLKSWNETIGEEEIVAVLPPKMRALYSWTPDVPSKEYYATGQYLFRLTTEVSWKTMTDTCYQFSDYSQLAYSLQDDHFQFNTKKQSVSEVNCMHGG